MDRTIASLARAGVKDIAGPGDEPLSCGQMVRAILDRI